MGKNKNENYQNLYDAWRKAHLHLTGSQVQDQVNDYWKKYKSDLMLINAKSTALLASVRKEPTKPKTQSSLFKFFQPTADTVSKVINDECDPIPQSAAPREVKDIDLEVEEIANCEETEPVPHAAKKNKAPAQDQLKDKIHTINSEIARLALLKKNNFATSQELLGLSKSFVEKAKLEKQLKRLQNVAQNSQQYRNSLNKQLQKVHQFQKNHPEYTEELQGICAVRPGAGRPRLEEKYPSLLQTIVDIVAPKSCADERRRTELLQACTTLDDLKNELERQISGVCISRSGLYIRLLPRNYSTIEGRRHVKTVPVKLVRAEKMKRKGHADDHFAAALNLSVKNLVEIMGPNVCLALSQDDKARISLGIPAATKQAPILMHMDYRVLLPDHDWVVAPRHKLIPSVVALLVIKDRKLSYSGPTMIAIRSGKHDKSTARSHSADFKRLLQNAEFSALTTTGAGDVKPIIVVFTDGGPDENPRFEKVVKENAKHFKEYNLDAIFVVCHAPGQSAYNQVERRMAPLSRDLSGLILPHDHFGTHLNSSGQTVDLELEVKNFEKAGQTLAEVWNSNIIDGYPVVAEYVPPDPLDNEEDMIWYTEKWKSRHVMQSQYCLQIVRCSEEQCCLPWRSEMSKILRSRFLPAPVKFKDTEFGPQACDFSEEGGYFGTLSDRLALSSLEPKWNGSTKIPFDLYCPSLKDELQNRICKACNDYFVSKKSLDFHCKAMHVSSIESINASINAVVERYSVQEPAELDSSMFIISDINAWIASEFEVYDE